MPLPAELSVGAAPQQPVGAFVGPPALAEPLAVAVEEGSLLAVLLVVTVMLTEGDGVAVARLVVAPVTGRWPAVERERLGVAFADVEPESPAACPGWGSAGLEAMGIVPVAGSETEVFCVLFDRTRAQAVPTDSATAAATKAIMRPSRVEARADACFLRCPQRPS